MTTHHDRTVYRGDSILFLIQVYQDLVTLELFSVPATTPITQPPPNSVPLNLTGAHVIFTIKNTIVDPDSQAVLQADTAALGGVTITTAASGKVQIGPVGPLVFIADSVVDLLYDVQVKDSSGRISTIESGVLSVVPDVTRAIT